MALLSTKPQCCWNCINGWPHTDVVIIWNRALWFWDEH